MKETTKKEKSKLSPELKRIGLMMRFSELRKRLRYKCLINGIKIEIKMKHIHQKYVVHVEIAFMN